MRQNIKIAGMSTTSESVLGESYNLVNLREKNGAMIPVSPRETIKTFNFKYDLLFMHQMAQFGIHYIGVRGGNVYFVYDTAPYETLLTRAGSDVQISQIGNVLNITSNQGVKHAIWYENAYVVIDANFDGDQTSSVIGPVKVDLKVDAELGSLVNGYQQFNTWYIRSENRISVTDLDLRKETAKALYIKMRGLMKAAGLLHGFCFACTAIELFDGSYILHSQPVLLGQTNDIGTRYSDGTNDYITNQKILTVATQNGAGDKEENGIYYMSFAGIDYPNTRIGSWNPSQSNSVYIGVNTFANKLKFKIASTIDEKFRLLIKSISIFVTPEIDMLDETKQLTSKGVVLSDLENIYLQPKTNAEILKELSENQLFYKVHEIPFDDLKTATDWLTIDLKGKLGDNLVNQEQLPVDNFTHHALIPVKQYIYNSRLHLLNYTSVLSRGWPYGYLQTINGIGQFEGIVYDNAKVTTVSYIKTENGTTVVKREGSSATYNPPTVISYPDRRATKVELYIEPAWQMMSVSELQTVYSLQQLSLPTDLSYWSNEETSDTLARLVDMSSGVASNGAKVNSRYILRKRTFTVEESSPSISIGDQGEEGVVISYVVGAGIVTYTEVESSNVIQGTWTVSRNKYTKYKYEYKLNASDTANFAYSINEDLKPAFVAGELFTSIPDEVNRNQIFQSGLKVSEVNNPFNFPAKNTYTIGNGRGLNLSSNAMRVSEGQFGQYPLYVFTEDGVCALQIGTDVLYITQAPISTEQPITDKILSTPYGICFITKKGLQIINGQQVDFIGSAHEQRRDELILDKISISSLEGAFMANNDEIYQFLRSNDLKMAYNPHESEILLNKGGDKIFCANLTNAQWYLSTEKWDNVVENSFPDLFVKIDNDTVSELKDYEIAKSVNGVEVKTKCALTTRSFNLGTEDYKRLSRVWIRGQIQAGEKIFAMLHGSIDGRTFKALKGLEFKKSTLDVSDSIDFKDLDLGLVTGKHRQYSISLAMTCGSETKINNLEIVVEKEYENEKI